MIKFREKWFWALCLAILVHVGVFLIFYINASQTDTTASTEERINTASDNSLIERPDSSLNNIDSPSTDKVYATTLTDTKVIKDSTTPADPNELIKGKQQAINSEAGLDTGSKSDSKNNNTNSKNSNAAVDIASETAPNSKATSQQAKSPPQRSRPIDEPIEDATQPNPPITASAVENLEAAKNNAGLLAIDVPTQQTGVKIDKDYLAAKSEVEELNNQLSAAINEVKKRNQQQIDQRQQSSKPISKDNQPIRADAE